MKGKTGILLFLLLPLLLSAQEDPFRTVRDRFRDGSPVEDALAALETLNSSDPVYDGSRIFFDVEYLRLKGQILIKAEREEEARTALEESLAFAPKLFGGDPSRAIAMIERILNDSALSAPLRFDLLLVLSHCYDREKRAEDALNAADEALTLYPRNPIMIEKREELTKKVK